MRSDDLAVAITQAGRRRIRLPRRNWRRSRGAATAAIVNEAARSRLCDGVIPMQAGPEIGVASTAFTAALVDLLLLAITSVRRQGGWMPARGELIGRCWRWLAWRGAAGRARRSGRYARLAETFHTSRNFLYLGVACTTPSPAGSSSGSPTSTPRATAADEARADR